MTLGQTDGAGPDAEFLLEVRRVLHHLYEPSRLRRSPLLALFGLNGQEGPGALQRLLTGAILALKPRSSVAPQAKAWRVYRTLSDRYVDQFSQREVAVALGVSVRQLKRQESQALEVLADYLWAHHDLQHRPRTPQLAAPEAGNAPGEGGADPASQEGELRWLERSCANEPAGAGALVQSLLMVIAPLTRALGVAVDCDLPESLPRLAVHVTSVRQACLNVLTAAIRSVPGGRVHVRAEAGRSQVCIAVHAEALRLAPSALPPDQLDNLEIARQLAGLSGGSLHVLPGEGGQQAFAARLTLPAIEQAAVLVIDDNVDTLQLYQRCLAGSRYPFIGVRDPQQAIGLAEELAPRIIILDVMLPGIDGWELLGRLREHPRTNDIPVIVCSILAQEELALTLGAGGFIRKPFTREALLSALDRQLGPPSTGSS